ncbi:transglycosylase domain-containing protein [Caenimonas terrae]|uniref:Biosynthetic peptidoglycan transglycosylase n=1 Tax=Caenimonas terrae TaxID=696074 RepID=A0ABW0NF91_9BURK
MKGLLRWMLLVLVAALALQLFFIVRIATMAVIAPQSTAFQRSEAWRIASEKHQLRWRQQWVPYARISDNLKRAVIASEDGSFTNHDGVDWEALEKAWQRNAKAEEQVARQAAQQAARRSASRAGAAAARPLKAPKIVGGSTITQQLAKNLLLSGERTLVRKGQELVLTFLLERMLNKERILEIYLNSVEWGEGVFGAEAAAQHYYRKSAAQLSAYESARLAVMLPRPRYFEKLPNSGYLASRASTIAARMRDAELP